MQPEYSMLLSSSCSFSSPFSNAGKPARNFAINDPITNSCQSRLRLLDIPSKWQVYRRGESDAGLRYHQLLPRSTHHNAPYTHGHDAEDAPASEDWRGHSSQFRFCGDDSGYRQVRGIKLSGI